MIVDVVTIEKMRNAAATLCAMMASSDGGQSFAPPCEAIGVDCFADVGPSELARLALYAAHASKSRNHRAWWAEAEAMLRMGWMPSDWRVQS